MGARASDIVKSQSGTLWNISCHPRYIPRSQEAALQECLTWVCFRKKGVYVVSRCLRCMSGAVSSSMCRNIRLIFLIFSHYVLRLYIRFCFIIFRVNRIVGSTLSAQRKCASTSYSFFLLDQGTRFCLRTNATKNIRKGARTNKMAILAVISSGRFQSKLAIISV